MTGLKLQPQAGGSSKMRNVCTSTVAVFLLGLCPLLAANKASLISLPHPASAPDSVSDGFLTTAVMTADTDPEGILPCFNCVSGPDIQTLLIALPLGAVTSGHAITIMVTGDNLNYNANASFTFNIKPNAMAAPILTESVSGDVYPGIWIAQFPVTAPAPGTYIVEGVISTGANLSQQTKVVGPLVVGAAN
ncbi:MAG TPA: hypothetical protein VMQ86_02730 [Bryobacteraceae bacterium]|jgi:hypothetical protein|nr:hypothetical protein [Bryobacteraceae bacterium]